MTQTGLRNGRRRADDRKMRRLTTALVVAGLLATALAGGRPAVGAPLPGTGSSCPLFPADNIWHADVSGLPVHARSAAWMSSMDSATRRLHPDFGPNGTAQPYGIPYQVVSGSAQKVAVTFDYDDQSDAGPYPFGPSTPVEDGSDAHALMVDKDNCTLYELYAVDWNGGHPTAGSGAIWDLKSHALRQSGWTSADAAGLPILPGLLRRDEVAAGNVDHAIRMTASRTDKRFIWPARHQAGEADNQSLPPMGAWFRLRAGYDISQFRPDTQVVLRAMQRHGMILADNGSNWYLTATSEPGWDSDMLNELKTVPASAFDAVDTSSLMAESNSGRVKSASSVTTATTPTTAPASPGTTATTARPATPTTTRPKSTPTTTRPAPTTTGPTAAADPPATAPEPATTTSVTSAAVPEPETTTIGGVHDGPLADAQRKARRSGRGWLAVIPAGLALAGGAVVWRRRRR